MVPLVRDQAVNSLFLDSAKTLTSYIQQKFEKKNRISSKSGILDPTRQYNRKLGCENQKETNKTSIMAKIHSLKDVLDNFHCMLFAHKANTSRTSAHSHMYVITLKAL